MVAPTTYYLIDPTDRSYQGVRHAFIQPPSSTTTAPPPETYLKKDQVWVFLQGRWVGASLSEQSLGRDKRALILDIRHAASAARAMIADHADEYKLRGWQRKIPIALRVLEGAGTDHDLAVLQAEADRRSKNETPQELAQKQIQRSQQFHLASAVIDGLESAAVDEVGKAQNADALEKIRHNVFAQGFSELRNIASGVSQ